MEFGDYFPHFIKHSFVFSSHVLQFLQLLEKKLVLSLQFLVFFLLPSMLHLKGELVVHFLHGIDQ